MTHNDRATPLNSYRLALFSVGKLSFDSRFLIETARPTEPAYPHDTPRGAAGGADRAYQTSCICPLVAT